MLIHLPAFHQLREKHSAHSPPLTWLFRTVIRVKHNGWAWDCLGVFSGSLSFVHCLKVRLIHYPFPSRLSIIPCIHPASLSLSLRSSTLFKILYCCAATSTPSQSTSTTRISFHNSRQQQNAVDCHSSLNTLTIESSPPC